MEDNIDTPVIEAAANSVFRKFRWTVGDVPNRDAIWIVASTKNHQLVSIHVTMDWRRNFRAEVLVKIDAINEAMEKLVS